VSHRVFAVDRVSVTASGTGGLHVTGFGQVGDDALRGPLRDSDACSDVAEADLGVVGQAEKHLGVVRQEGSRFLVNVWHDLDIGYNLSRMFGLVSYRT